MARYTQDSRERVRDAVDFEELVGARTELRRSGARRLSGLCPFHEERTPSFGIDPVEKLYHCFGCGAGGDVFSFVMETEGLDFAGALESLADRYGVQLEREAEDPRKAARREQRDRLLALLERTAAYYVRVLWESPEALPADEIAVLGDTGSARIDRLVHDLVEHSERAGDIVQGDEVGTAMLRLRSFMFEHVYLGPTARAEHAKIERVLRGLFDWYCEHPEELPEGDSLAERVTDWLAGMTDRYAIRAWAERFVPQGLAI